MDLTPTAFRIVLYLFSVIDYGNIIHDFFSQSRIAKDLGLNKSNVSRAFKELFERKILFDTIDNQVYLNSNLLSIKGIPRRFNEDLMDKFKKSRLETEDFANSFNFYRAGSKTKSVKNSRRRYPADGIPFLKILQRGNFLRE